MAGARGKSNARSRLQPPTLPHHTADHLNLSRIALDRGVEVVVADQDDRTAAAEAQALDQQRAVCADDVDAVAVRSS
jgi:hypothetical protein